jgi:hypothetical protein
MNNKTVHTTDNKAVITGVTALSAALAFLTLRVFESVTGVHINGQSTEVMAAVTVLYNAVLNYLGFIDAPRNNDQNSTGGN